MTPPDPTAPASTRDRVVSTAVRLTAELGWAQVTMGKLADAVGVSRQTVHHEVGTKAGLAEAMVDRELTIFLHLVERAFDAEPDDLVAALRRAAHDVMVSAEDNPLLRAVVSATHGGDTELLPLLTTRADSLLHAASAVVLERVRPYGVPLPAPRLAVAVDSVVRLVLSHLTRPTDDPAGTADDLAWIAARVLG